LGVGLIGNEVTEGDAERAAAAAAAAAAVERLVGVVLVACVVIGLATLGVLFNVRLELLEIIFGYYNGNIFTLFLLKFMYFFNFKSVIFANKASAIRTIKQQAHQELMNIFRCEVKLKLIVVTDRDQLKI
jgi:hypothetical protein